MLHRCEWIANCCGAVVLVEIMTRDKAVSFEWCHQCGVMAVVTCEGHDQLWGVNNDLKPNPNDSLQTKSCSTQKGQQD